MEAEVFFFSRIGSDDKPIEPAARAESVFPRGALGRLGK